MYFAFIIWNISNMDNFYYKYFLNVHSVSLWNAPSELPMQLESNKDWYIWNKIELKYFCIEKYSTNMVTAGITIKPYSWYYNRIRKYVGGH